MRNRLLVALALVVAWGVAAVALAGDDDRPQTAREAPAPARPGGAETPVAAESAPTVVTVRRAQGVPDGWARRAAAAPGVERVVRVKRGQALLRRSTGADGRAADRVRSGYAIPIDTLVADPRAYASMLPDRVRRAVASAGTSDAVLSRSAAKLRRAGRGGTLTLAGGPSVKVAAVVDDVHLNGTEMLLARDGDGVETRAASLLVRLEAPRFERGLRRAFRGERVRVVRRGGSPTGVARGGIARPAELKRRFGEVAVRLPFGDDWVKLDPAWVDRNIVARRVPLLGSVTCNRRMLPALGDALADVERRGLGRLIDRGDYAGCYAPRRIPSSGSLSLHALGLAVDFNASSNSQYSDGDQDPRLVRIMERHGFTWGGRWPTAPDPMHFEFQGD
jgi:hypothetical protein